MLQWSFSCYNQQIGQRSTSIFVFSLDSAVLTFDQHYYQQRNANIHQQQQRQQPSVFSDEQQNFDFHTPLLMQLPRHQFIFFHKSFRPTFHSYNPFIQLFKHPFRHIIFLKDVFIITYWKNFSRFTFLTIFLLSFNSMT
jgi:hypothetical protein